jgi:acyl transferase domain-containing protein/acyl carrier protein
MEPIAIIGLACRFPGAASPSALWNLLAQGSYAKGVVPRDRWDADAYFDADPAVPGRSITRHANLIDHVNEFDPLFFRISPREAEQVDPQQRLLLELSWEALEDAAVAPTSLVGSPTGVFFGIWLTDYAHLVSAEGFTQHTVTGQNASVACGRVSYAFGLRGPSLAVNTGCSSSLVAVHLACQSLRDGECTMALAGAANLILTPESMVLVSKLGGLSPDGRCKTFDASADGFARAEGAAVVVLKALSRAVADGDPIHCVIRGSAVNNDGVSEGLTVPSQAAQEALLLEACARAGVATSALDYVEAHGTGTRVGDPIEARALGVLGRNRPLGRPLLVGSVKTNLGHTEAAAGMAGLAKVVLAMRHRQIPPNVHFETPNPNIDFAGLGLEVVAAPREWPQAGERPLAGVSSFGFGGTNCHVVLEGWPDERSTEAPAAGRDHLLPLSAHTAGALRDLARTLVEHFAGLEEGRLGDLARTAALRRAHHDQRIAVVARRRDDLRSALEACARGEAHPALVTGVRREEAPRVVFVFPGQGSQWHGMALQLCAEEPAFRAALETCAESIRGHVGWSLFEALEANEDASPLARIDVLQPTLFAIEVALAALWQSWGVVPAAVVAHSMGEVAAAHVAGALSLDDAARVICTRSRLLLRVSGRGAMLATELTFEEAQRAVAGRESLLSVAVSNGPRSTVLSGDVDAIEELAGELAGRGVFCRKVKVDVASHSPQMDTLGPDLLAALSPLRPRPCALPMFSTVTAAPVEGPELGAEYWVRNLRQPVRFHHTVRRLLDRGHDAFVELSPHPVLLPAIEPEDRPVLLLPSSRRGDERPCALSSLGQLYAVGQPVAWDAVHPGRGRPVRLPPYPWQRERVWLSVPTRSARSASGGHPWLGDPRSSSAHGGTHFFEGKLSTNAPAYLADHQVRGAVVLPAAAYVEAAMAAAWRLFGEQPIVVENVEFSRALLLPEDGAIQVQLVWSEETPGRSAAFRLASIDDGDGAWRLHAAGQVRIDDDPSAQAPPPCGGPSRTGDEHYRALQARGLRHGPAFRGIERLRLVEGGADADISLPASAVASGHVIHPVLLDSAFQAVGSLLAGSSHAGSADAYVPIRLARLRLNGRTPSTVSARARFGREADGWLEGDVWLLDADGRTVVEALGLRLQRLVADDVSTPWLHEVAWSERPLPSARCRDAQGRWLLVGEGALVEALAGQLEARGGSCHVTVEPSDLEGRWRGAVYFAPLFAPQNVSLLIQSQEETSRTLVALVKALVGERSDPPRLTVVTTGVHTVEPESTPDGWAQEMVWGLGRVIGNEHPGLGCRRVDLGGVAEVEALLDELLLADPGEDEVVLRGLRRWAPRLVPLLADSAPPAALPAVELVQSGGAVRATISTPGVLDTLHLQACARPTPGPGQVLLEVEACGLNFMNVLSAMGLCPGYAGGVGPLGLECAGRVVALGDGVSDLRPGDTVMGMAYNSMGSHALADARLLADRPRAWSAAEAATVPVAFLTAYYALHELARLEAGERVLIHSATGGVGLAALQVARWRGAEVVATAGSEERRTYLRGLGVNHVFDSRTLRFAAEVERLGGVDVVLNALTGRAVEASLAVLRPHGRFLEIGKRDIYENAQVGLRPFRNNLSYFAVDLDQMARSRPARVAALLVEVMRRVVEGHFKPLPATVFPAARLDEAFHRMAQARHLGKLVVSFPDAEAMAVVDTAAAPRVHADGLYLITGGLGGLGLALAEWMVGEGARHLALVSRRAPSAAAAEAVAALDRRGARVRVCGVDVADAGALGAMLAGLRAEGPPLRGVVHAAGVLEDHLLLDLAPEHWRTVMAPKVGGAWNLHELTRDEALDFFVMFSSGAALLGSPGQGNYAAANSFMDGLARHRRREGRPALSVAWAPFSDVGLAVAPERGARLAAEGLPSLAPAQGMALLGRLLGGAPAYTAALRVDAARWIEAHPGAARASLLANLRQRVPEPPTAAPLPDTLRAFSSGRARREALEEHLADQLARVLKLALVRVDRQASFKQLGLDSLMAVELRNRLERSLGLRLSATLVWNYPTIAQLVPYLAGKLELPLDEPLPTLERVRAADLLAQELAALNRENSA